MTGATQTIYPFSPEAADGIWEVVKLANGDDQQRAQAATVAGDLHRRMARPQQLGYWRSQEVDDQAVAEEWHKLRSALRAVANDRPGGVTRLVERFDVYRQLQTDAALETARAARADAELSFDHHSTNANYDALVDAGNRLLAIRGQSMTSTGELMRSDDPPSVSMAAVHEWTSDWHELAEDRAATAEQTNERSAPGKDYGASQSL